MQDKGGPHLQSGSRLLGISWPIPRPVGQRGPSDLSLDETLYTSKIRGRRRPWYTASTSIRSSRTT